MIFRPVLVDRILAGNKTQTRRTVRYHGGLRSDRYRFDCTYKVGRSYAVQPGRGRKGVARIKVTDIRRERWKDITERDAIAEGFKRLDGFTAKQQFFAYVYGIYQGNIDLEAECWVIEFELEDTDG